VFRRLYPTARVQSLEVVNVGLVERPLASIVDHFRAALGFIEAAGEDVNQVVRTNLRRVAITRGQGERIAVAEGKYGTGLMGHEGRNPFYLACRLLWAATYIGIRRQSSSDEHADDLAREKSYDAILDFAARFPEGEEWVKYIERERLRLRR
jgi:hypothetical protein